MTVPTYKPRVWAEVWKRPGHATFGKVIQELPFNKGSYTSRGNGVGEGTGDLPSNYTRLDEILKPDPVTPLNAVSSLVRIFQEGVTGPIAEWLPAEMTGADSKDDTTVATKGADIFSILGYGRVEAWDWTGIDDEVSKWPDWIYGGRNILGDLESTYKAAVTRIYTSSDGGTADGGTFTIGVSFNGGAIQNTSAIAYNASAVAVQTALIALSNVDLVRVDGTGTQSDPWRIQTVLPEGEYNFSTNSAGLVGAWRATQAGASGGTWTATVDGQTTAAIAWNASAATVKTEIEALSTVTTCTVLRVTTADGFYWTVWFNVPDTITTFTVGDSLTPGAATIAVAHLNALASQTLETVGAVVPQGWTPSFNPVNNLFHGTVEEFRISTFTSPDPAAPACDDTGLAIMFNGGQDSFPGIQKIVPVKPGGRYYGHATAYAQGASATYRFVIRDLFENPIAAEPDFNTGTTLTADTWTTFDDLVAIDIPDDVDRVIVRFASVGGGNPPKTFVTCLELREGMPPTTWGNIWTQLHADATSDHASRRVWQIGATAASYLSLDFNATVDSAGAAWVDPLVSITLKRGQNYLRVASECFKQGYEGRIVPNNYVTGTWKFQLYNPGTCGTVLNASSSPVIMGGRDVSKRDVRKFLPTFTDWAVEAGGQAIARERSANAITALGRIEGYTPNQDLGSITEAGNAAATALATGLLSSQSLTYTVAGVQGAYPLVDYKVFDTINVDDPPDVPKTARRIRQIQLAWDKTGAEYTMQLGAESYVGVGAIYEGVNRLLTEFKAIRDRPGEATDPLNYFKAGGGAPTVVVAALDSSQYSKDRADFQCTGIDDQNTIQRALDALASTGGTCWLCEGVYYLEIPASGGAIVVPPTVQLTGIGQSYNGATMLEMQNVSDPGRQPLIRMRGASEVRNLTLYPFNSALGIQLTDFEGSMKITDCWIETNDGACIEGVESNNLWIERNFLFVGSPASEDDSNIHIGGTGGIVENMITRNYLSNGWHGVFLDGDQGKNFIQTNYIPSSWYSGIRLKNDINPIFATTIIGNVITVPGQDSDGSTGEAGIYVSADGADIDPTTAQSNGLIIADNIIEVASVCHGIRLTDVCLVNVHDNYIEQQGLHGIYLEDANSNQIHDNTIQEPGTFPTTTYDGIFLVTSDDNYIRANTIIEHRGGSPLYFRYAINVSDAASDRNIVVGNDLRLAGSGTGFINNAGTGTRVVYPGAAAPVGDNFV